MTASAKDAPLTLPIVAKWLTVLFTSGSFLVGTSMWAAGLKTQIEVLQTQMELIHQEVKDNKIAQDKINTITEVRHDETQSAIAHVVSQVDVLVAGSARLEKSVDRILVQSNK